MNTRRTLLRSAAILALAVSIVGSSALAPSASAAPITAADDLSSVVAKKNKANDNNDGESGLGDIPIIGDVVGQFKDAPPEQIVHGVLDFAGVAADTAIPLIRGLVK